MANVKFDYTKRNFAEIRNELVNFVKQYYPTIIQDFSDESLGMLLLELVAGVGDITSQNLDNVFNETQLDSAQLLTSVLAIARNLGVNIGNVKASATLIDVRINVPVKGDTYNKEYCPIIRQGMVISGGGKEFETLSDIDFNSNYNAQGVPNLLVSPNFDENQRVVSYDLIKREIAVAGRTVVGRYYISSNLYKPFLEIELPETDIINIESIVSKVGNVTETPTLPEFYDEESRWYEVDYLSQQYVTILESGISKNQQYKPNKVKKVTKKFIKEFNSRGICTLIFGAGRSENTLDEVFSGTNMKNAILSYIDNEGLGLIPDINTTLFVRYRVGGGAASIANANTINNVISSTFIIGGSREQINKQVKASIRINNSTPALGGGDRLTIEAIRKMASYNYSSQNRGVTLSDYQTLVLNMDGEFGSPFKTISFLENNKIIISILGLSAEGKLENQSNSILKDNIENYLSTKKMINDYIEIRDGRIYNLAFDYDILIIDSIKNPNQLASIIINKIVDYFNINNKEMNEDVYLDDLNKELLSINGVISIMQTRVYNKVGNGYSLNKMSMPLLIPNDPLGELNVINNILYSDKDSMFEIKNPNKDIKITFKRRRDL